MKRLSHYLYHGTALLLGVFVICDGFLGLTSMTVSDTETLSRVSWSVVEVLLGLAVIGVALKRILETPEGGK
jgi:hypothetical protein